ncbi:acid phosphatase/vanadium-dependent haloperoxidase related [Alkaliphilus metalliredigens QYMF]|uniref:Acid phosphatase/vanadium-dependent haloperoxidase related n=1 Tax=Alkaliphilus metalliredigens (strain QYMF) TaxID=293826 RepID=A6TR41_ALKMQ|nr:divergent PAP2 family protein [Alkaliphilus metalliredigens]ABR48659.1 acid phosphatase/vanadium-dependent haloperoxidase related [Alkaliphilus metalliredigens QYMF]
MGFFHGIGNNKILGTALLAWFIAQTIKVIHTFIVDKRFNLSRFVGSGGMPSSHSSFVMGLTTAIGLDKGFDSAIFAVSLAFSLVIMYDAAGVRRAVGKQAIILNRMIEDIHHKRKLKLTEQRLKELIGHTPIEVLAGAILGIVVAKLMI